MLMHPSLAFALEVVEAMKVHESELAVPALDLLVEPFHNGRHCGLSISNAKTSKRVSVMLESETRIPTVTYGDEKDFVSGTPIITPKSRTVEYRLSMAPTVAGLCLDYLVDQRPVWKTGDHEEESE